MKMITNKELVKQAEKSLVEQFEIIDEIRDFNQEKVLNAFIENKVAPEHFYTVSGYGHDDLGREVLDRVFADVFKAEKALVRVHFASGTHTLACALFGNLKYGDKLVSVAGAPYDTMQEVIGVMGDEETKRSSLIGNGVLYDEVPLLNGSDIDFEALEQKIDETVTMVLIQRSKGYSTRKSLTIETVEKICKVVTPRLLLLTILNLPVEYLHHILIAEGRLVQGRPKLTLPPLVPTRPANWPVKRFPAASIPTREEV